MNAENIPSSTVAKATPVFQGSFTHGTTEEEERLRLHVVLAQVLPNDHTKGEIDPILPRMQSLVHMAAEAQADVIVFPEYFLVGSTHTSWSNVHLQKALEDTTVQPEWLGQIRQMAREARIAIVTGSAVERRESLEGPLLFNTSYFIDFRGDVQGSYTKRYLWHTERHILSPASDKSHPLDRHPPQFVFETARGLRLRGAMVMCVRISIIFC